QRAAGVATGFRHLSRGSYYFAGGRSAPKTLAARFFLALWENRSAFPAAWLAFGQTRVHPGVISFLAEPRVGFLLQFLRRRDAESFVRVHEDDLAARTHETEQQRAFAGMRGHKFAHGFQLFRFQVRGMQPQVNLPGEFFRRVLQRHDFLWKNFRAVIAGVHFTDDEDGFVGCEQFAIFVVVLVQAKNLHRAFEVFERDHRVRLDALLW